MVSSHNEIEGSLEIDQFKDILSIPGIELTSMEGTHILIYFYAIRDLKKFYRNIEVINAENMNKWNLRSALLGLDLNKGITGGSDGHRVSQMGNAVTYARCKCNRRAFLDAIKARRTRVIGKEIDLIHKLTSNALKLRTSIKNYPDLIEKNLRYSHALINLKTKEIKEIARRSLNGKNKVRRRRFEIS